MSVTFRRSLGRSRWSLAFFIAIVSISGTPLWALITGGEGDDHISDPSWPKGADVVFNSKGRVAHWVGPAFGGGQSFADCRGDAVAIQRVLDDFAKIETPLKRVVLRDGTGTSVWLNIRRQVMKPKNAKIDWSFMVWNEESRRAQRRMPVGLSSIGKTDPAIVAQLEIYTGGSIRWANVAIPDGLEVLDQRLEAHGFSDDDGTVLEGHVVDVATRSPLIANLQLQKKGQRKANGGYFYEAVNQVETDAKGHWVITKTPENEYRLVLMADGYATRIIGYRKVDEQPRWFEFNSGLSKAGRVSGQVIDRDGQPLADVNVSVHDFDAKNTGRYEVLEGNSIKTDAEGCFTFESLPISNASVRVYKLGYVRPGLGQEITIPVTDLRLQMESSASLLVRVNFADAKPPTDYLVQIVPEGGARVGKWSGSASINADQWIEFENVPAGKYTITGGPNPGRADQQTAPATIELKLGERATITLKAR